MKSGGVKKTRIFFDMHLPEWNDKKVASSFDIDAIARTFAESGVESAVVFAKCQYGNFYYDTRLGHKHEGLGNLDLLRSLTEKLHRHSIEVLAYYSVAWDELQASLHPEWLTADSSGNTGSDQFRWKTLCVNSPYRALVKAHLAEIASSTGVDGFWIDMTIIGKDRCCCSYCNEQFKALYGIDIHTARKNGKESELLEFRYNYIESFYKEMYAALRKTGRDLSITNNYWGYPYSPKNMGSRAVGAVHEADFITGEAYADWTGLEAPSFFSRFLAGIAGSRPFEALVGRFVNTWDYTRKTPDQLFYESMAVFSLGGTVTIDDEPFYDGKIDETLYKTHIAPAFHVIRKWSFTVSGSRLRYAGILHSQTTKNGIPETNQASFIRSITGAYKLMQERHLPVDFVFDESLDADCLSLYRVILLPSVWNLDKKVLTLLEEYIRRGGTVVGFGRSALFEFICKDQIRYEGPSNYSLSYYPMKDENPLIRGNYCRYLASKTFSGEAGPAIIDPIIETSGEIFFHNNLPSPFRNADCPAWYGISLGKGHLLQFNQPVCESYAKQRAFCLRDAIADAISARAGSPPFWIDAPSRLDAAAYHDQEGMRFFIHLFAFAAESSLACGILDTMNGNFERPYAVMEKREPVLSIGISLQTGAGLEINSVASLYEKNALRWEKRENTLNICLERLGLWDVIEIRYAKI